MNRPSFDLKGAAVVGIGAMLGFALFGGLGAIIGVVIAIAFVN